MRSDRSWTGFPRPTLAWDAEAKSGVTLMRRKRPDRIHRLRQAEPARQPLIRQEEILGQLYEHGGGALFLNALTKGELEEILRRTGILDGCRKAGFEQLEIGLDTTDAFKHVLRVSPPGRPDLTLAEFVLKTGSYSWQELGVHLENLNLLVVEWVLLQNPNGSFVPGRPPLPGQKHPGLGIGANVVSFLIELAQRLRADGIVEHPEYYHAAVMYSRTFRFSHPETEGILMALQRDLVNLSFSHAAWAVHQGLVREGRKVVRWVPEEQVIALAGPLAEYFASDPYSAAVREAKDGHEYRLVRGRVPAIPGWDAA